MAESVERKQRIEDWYFANPTMDLHDVAEEFEISYETVRYWARERSWETRRTIEVLRAGFPDSITEQADMIRAVLLSRILNSTDDSARDLKGLIESWQELIVIQVPEESNDVIDRDALLSSLGDV